MENFINYEVSETNREKNKSSLKENTNSIFLIKKLIIQKYLDVHIIKQATNVHLLLF